MKMLTKEGETIMETRDKEGNWESVLTLEMR